MVEHYEVVKSLKDWRGHTMTAGKGVVYPAMSGRSVEMIEAVVMEIRKHGGTVKKRTKVDDVWTWVDSPVYTVILRPQRNSRQFWRGFGRDVSISIVENITVLP